MRATATKPSCPSSVPRGTDKRRTCGLPDSDGLRWCSVSCAPTGGLVLELGPEGVSAPWRIAAPLACGDPGMQVVLVPDTARGDVRLLMEPSEGFEAERQLVFRGAVRRAVERFLKHARLGGAAFCHTACVVGNARLEPCSGALATASFAEAVLALVQARHARAQWTSPRMGGRVELVVRGPPPARLDPGLEQFLALCCVPVCLAPVAVGTAVVWAWTLLVADAGAECVLAAASEARRPLRLDIKVCRAETAVAVSVAQHAMVQAGWHRGSPRSTSTAPGRCGLELVDLGACRGAQSPGLTQEKLLALDAVAVVVAAEGCRAVQPRPCYYGHMPEAYRAQLLGAFLARLRVRLGQDVRTMPGCLGPAWDRLAGPPRSPSELGASTRAVARGALVGMLRALGHDPRRHWLDLGSWFELCLGIAASTPDRDDPGPCPGVLVLLDERGMRFLSSTYRAELAALFDAAPLALGPRAAGDALARQ